jgi:hypothetical protein
MAYDLQWLWSVIKALVPSIADWFESLWDTIEPITNLGQGFVAGFAAFASALWDAIRYFSDTFGNWISDAFSWIYTGFTTFARDFGAKLYEAFGWLSNAAQWIASQIYAFGQWIYTSVYSLWEWWMNILYGLYTALAGFFSGIATAVGNWWSNVASGINSYFTSLFTGIRSKIVNTIIADVSLYYGWKCVERMTQFNSAKDLLYGLSGMLIAPFAGAIFGSIVDGLLPTPSTEPIPIVPQISPFSFTPPSLSITTPTRPSAPYPISPPTTGVIGLGLPYDINLSFPSISYDRTLSSKDSLNYVPSLSYTATIESMDAPHTVPSVDYERRIDGVPINDISVYRFGPTPIYNVLQKGYPLTNTYVESDWIYKTDGSDYNAYFEVKLSKIVNPGTYSGWKVRTLLQKNETGGTTLVVDLQLRQGSTLIARYYTTFNYTDWTWFEIELTESQAQSITDYSDLRIYIEVHALDVSDARRLRVAYATLEMPQA